MADESQISERGIPSVDRASEMEQKYLLKRAGRKEQMESTGHNITIFLLYVTVGVLALIGLSRFLHLILPHCWQWLSEEDQSKIDHFFIHGTIGAIVVEFLRGKISDKRE